MTARLSNWDCRAPITYRRSFRNSTGTLTGETYNTRERPFSCFDRGWLPNTYDVPLDVDFVVFSYATPIAWHTPDKGWTIPAVKYSPTTTRRHQPVVRSALAEQVAA